jgi:hypothetical protein
MKFKDFVINEERLGKNDKKWLKDYIKNPKNDTFTIQSFKNKSEVDVKKIKDGVQFQYDLDNYELTNELVDLVDSMGGYKFSTKSEKSINAMNFKVTLKTPKGR